MQAAAVRFGPKREVPIPTAARHKPCLCRCVWDLVFIFGFKSEKLLTNYVSHSWTTVLDWVVDEWVRLQEQ